MMIDGQLIWITGASSGIGEALAYELSRRGARLVLSARNAPRLMEVKQACEKPESHLIVPLDLADEASIARAVAIVRTELGVVDTLIHNGGISQRALAQETRLEVDRQIMETNYFGAVCLTKAVLPDFLERKRGHFVVVSSLMGRFASPMRSAYAASKHALQGFFDALRAEVLEQGIHVTVICPGFVNTNVSLNALTGDGSKTGVMDEKIAQGLSPAQVATRIAKALERQEEEVVIAGSEKLGIPLRALAPTLFNRLIRKATVR